MTTSLYVHVPFCVVKCGYCDFTSYELDGDDRQALDVFLVGLERELALAHVPRSPVSVFIGGGTPSFLDEDRLRRFFEVLGRCVDLPACPEVTMEANPESVTATKGQIARQAGVNRISIGAQSFAPRWLSFLDRAHSADDTRRAVAAMREAGFDNLSLDLMFGLPGQQSSEWERDLEQALELSPDHLSCYNLTFEPGTRLTRERDRGSVEPNDPEIDKVMFLTTREQLADAGFSAYEVSNFAGRRGPCAHNDHYWLQGDYVGLGPGAASHRAGVRSTNLKVVSAWAQALGQGLLPTGEAETLTRGQRIREALWLGIRRRDGVDLAAVLERIAVSSMPTQIEAAIADLEAVHLVALRGDCLGLTSEGLLMADTVGERLLTA